jgi:MFS family permease
MTARKGAREAVAADAWWMLVVLSLLYLLSFLDRANFPILADAAKADLHATDTEMSLILGPAFTAVYAIFGIPLGWAADRLPRRWVIFAGTALWSAAASAGGLVRTSTQLLFARAGIGVGEAALSPSAFSMIADRFPPQRLAIATAIYQAAPWLGGAAAFALTPLILRHFVQIQSFLPSTLPLHAWQAALIITGLPGVAIALLVFTFSEPVRKRSTAANSGKSAGLWDFLKSRRLVMALFTAAFGLISALAYAVQAWVPSYLHRRFGMAPYQFGPLLSVAGVVGACSLLMKGVFMDWLYGRGVRDAYMRIYLVLLGLSVPAAIAMFTISSFGLFAACYLVVQVITVSFMGFLAPTLQIITPPELRGRVVGFFLLIFSACGAVGPVIIGIVTDRILGSPARIGVALATMAAFTVPIAFGLLCFVLRPLRAAIAAMPEFSPTGDATRPAPAA